MIAEFEGVAVADKKEILSAKEAAELLNEHDRTIARWCEKGDTFPNAYKSNPGLKNSRWRIPRADVEALLARRASNRP